MGRLLDGQQKACLLYSQGTWTGAPESKEIEKSDRTCREVWKAPVEQLTAVVGPNWLRALWKSAAVVILRRNWAGV